MTQLTSSTRELAPEGRVLFHLPTPELPAFVRRLIFLESEKAGNERMEDALAIQVRVALLFTFRSKG